MTPTMDQSADLIEPKTPDELATTDDQQTRDPNDFGENNRDIPDCLKKALLAAFRAAQAQEKYLRRQEIMQDSQHRFYDMGIQHIYYGRDFSWIQATPGGTFSGVNGQESFGEYIDDYDIFHPFALIQQAKLSENPPGIDFQAVDPSDADDIEAAAAAEGMRHEFDRNNDVKNLQQSIIYHLQMGGRAVIWTRSEDCPETFGGRKDGQQQRRTTATVYGTIEAKVPIFANDRKDMWYVLFLDDPDIKMAKTDYPWIADKLSAGRQCLDENAYERIARLGIIQGAQQGRWGFQIGDSMQHLIGRGHGFFRLAAFQDMKEDYVGPDGQHETVTDEDGEHAKTIREKLEEIFPEGAHVCVVGDQYSESWNESMDDCVTVGNAFIGKGQSRMPVMRSMVVVQDRFNTSMNYTAEMYDYGAPSTYINCGDEEYASITKQHSSPWQFRQLKELPAGFKVGDMVHREESPELPSSFQNYIEFLVGALPQFQLSVPPSIWGQASQDQKTASGYQLAASQAMGILGVYWKILTAMLADIYYHNCIAVQRDDQYPDKITIPGEDGRNIVIQKGSLSKGRFRAFPDTDSGFPETTSAKRQTLEKLLQLIAPTPLGAQFLASPDNIAAIVREYGSPELVMPEAESREKQLREIEKLLASAPVLSQPIAQLAQAGATIPDILKAIGQAKQAAQTVQQQAMVAHAATTIAAQATGQPAPPVPQPFDPSQIARSSVQPWPSDYHIWEAKKCKDWLSSDDRNTEETIGRPDGSGNAVPNIAGILNVVLHMMEHDALAAMQAPPAMGPVMAPQISPGAAAPTPAPGAPTARIQ